MASVRHHIAKPEIENRNLFQALGKQIVRWTRRWRHNNSSDSDSPSITRVKRSLKSIRHDGNNKVDHPVRHHGKHRRKLEPMNLTVISSSPPTEGNQTSGPDLPHLRRLADHDMCYSTNQVLVIIAVTCAVNFAFIFVVMTLVHVCNRNGGKLDGFDAVILAENGDCDSQDRKMSSNRTLLRRENSSYSSVQEYVNSLPSNFERTASMLSLHSLHVARNPSQENLLRKSNSLHTSFSMEDLLFMG